MARRSRTSHKKVPNTALEVHLRFKDVELVEAFEALQQHELQHTTLAPDNLSRVLEFITSHHETQLEWTKHVLNHTPIRCLRFHVER